MIFSVDSVSRSGHFIRVSFKRFVKIDFDRANICGTYHAVSEKAVSPFAHEVDTFVRFEYVSVGLEVARIDGFEVASDMTTVVGHKVCG